MTSKRVGRVIAIDGPAGAGKSSTTKALSERLRFTHIDTGALYRAAAQLCLEKKLLSSSSKECSKGEESRIANEVKVARFEMKQIESETPKNRVFVNGLDITHQIRTPDVSMAASKISAIPAVRAALLGLQRKLGCAGDSILEGRDIGTVIFPDADVKIFLVASLDARAERRWKELEEKGNNRLSREEVKAQISERDHGDSTRSAAPLKKAGDAIEYDTSDRSFEEVVGGLEELIRSKLGL